MPREKEAFRDIMEDLLLFSGGKRELSVSEVAKYTGRERHNVQKTFAFKGSGHGQRIHIAVLARELA